MLNLKTLVGVAGVVGLCGVTPAQYPAYPVYPQPVFPVYPQPVMYPQPSVPLIVTPNTPLGFNPLTGGINTTNTQINDSFFDPGRNAARFNGTMRTVDRPIYDAFGNVVGRQSGVEWYNPQTGRWNGEVDNVTPNGHLGDHQQKQFYSPNPMAGRPSTRPGSPQAAVPPSPVRPHSAPPTLPSPYRPR
jgi:hypothetical protein